MLVVAAGCKSKAVEKDSAETIARLADYERAIADKDTLIKQLNAQIAGLGDSVVVTLEGREADGTPGPIAEISGRGPHARSGDPGSEPNPSDVEVYKAFIARVDGSHGRMRKCYEAALKKSSDLQAKSVTMVIRVKLFTTGRVGAVTFQPEISPDFVRCASAVAQGWTFDKLPEPVSVEYQIRLKPQ